MSKKPECTVLLHFKDDVTAAQQLPPDIQLGVGGPLGVLLQPLPYLFISQDVEAVEGHFDGVEGRHHLLAEATTGRFGIALQDTTHVLNSVVVSWCEGEHVIDSVERRQRSPHLIAVVSCLAELRMQCIRTTLACPCMLCSCRLHGDHA